MAGHVKKPKEDKNKKPVVVASIETNEELNAFFAPNVYDAVAITSVKKADGTFLILKVEVDSEKLIAGAVTVLDTATGKFEANEKFKLNVVKHGII